MNRAILSLLAASSLCAACNFEPNGGTTVAEVVADAELIVLAEVLDVSYANSEGEVSIPHTYVTLAVEKILKGHYQDSDQALVLRFAGGVGRLEVDLADLPFDGGQSGSEFDALPEGVQIDEDRGVAIVEDAIFGVSETTLFDVGERSVLMVRNNGAIQCPLVGCADGRFRVVDGFVFTESGRELSIHLNGGLVLGGSHPLYEVEHNVVGDFEIQYAGDNPVNGPDEGSASDSYRLHPVGESLPLGDFLAWIQGQVEAAENSGGQMSFVAVKNLVPSEPFQVPAPTPEPFASVQDASAEEPTQEEGA